MACRHCAEEGPQSSTSASTGSRKMASYRAWLVLLKPQNPQPVTHFLQQGHTYSNEAITNSVTPWRQSIQTCEPMGVIFSQTIIHGLTVIYASQFFNVPELQVLHLEHQHVPLQAIERSNASVYLEPSVALGNQWKKYSILW